jgi:anti-sigma regulatory factor (Ser/Thr protein kinase)
MADTFNASYPAVPGAVGEARRAVAAFAHEAGVSGKRLDAIKLAVGEALANAAMHAYRDVEPGEVHVSVAVAERELWVLVADDGSGLRVGGTSEGLGQGLRLISGAADGLTILDRSGGGTEVRMRFDLGPAQPRGSVSSASSPAASRFSTTT